ncbi:MAG: T9SS type A sorting domain-containing protein [Saprospiraceae bacterium]|nr:T9SS type A sorting domain-containing protein [Saprospiraceae bacterium]
MIFDTNGRLYKVFLQQTLSNDFNISDLHAGTYIIKILNYKGISQRQIYKIVVT